MLKHLIISITFRSSRGDCDQLALHVSKVANMSSTISTPHAGVDSFLDSEDESRHSTSVVSTDFSAFASASKMLPDGFVQLFSENVLEVPGHLNQQKSSVG